MLGPIAKKYMFTGYKAGIWFLSVPFEWEDKNKIRVRAATSKFRIFRLYENTFYQIFGVAWCGFRSFQLYGKSEESMEDLTFYVIAMVITVGLIFPACLYMNFVRAREELVKFAYDFIDYGTEFQEKFVLPEDLARQRSKAHDATGIFLASLWYLQVVVFQSVSFTALFLPELPLLLTGTLQFPDYVYYPLVVIQAIVINAYLTTWYINQSIYCLPAIEYLFSLAYMLKEMELGSNEYTTTGRLRTAEEFILNYRALQVLHANAMYIYSPLVLPSNEWTYVFVATYCIFGAIRLDGIVAILMAASAFMLLYYLFVVFMVFAKVRRNSVAVLESWKREKHSPWVTKAVESLTPISISIGGYYFVDHGMMLQLYRSIFEGAADLLML